MTALRLAGFLSCILGIILFFPSGIPASPVLPAEFSYYALISSEDYFQEIRHYQANELIRQVIYASPFPPTVTIARPDLDLIWFFDEGGWEYFSSPYSPMLVANVLDLEVEAADQLVSETLGTQEILGYNCEVIRFRNPVTPGWEVTLWKAPELGHFSLKKLERIVKGGVVISEILVEVIDFNVGPIPPEYFELPPDLIPAEDSRDEEEKSSPDATDDNSVLPVDFPPDDVPPVNIL
ncbi:MAG: hypothetical protein GX085_10255 [Firmicutes bacterium]|nr:hypothetical protein [Bacillota bacterium]